ncbi:MAG: class I SAM-dependent methyltransferase [Candidatus Magnetomorum sp.]|nr:class I SAM-dependent methyltransferase [Candidatus Magnetomorum sp.]
MLVEMIKKYQTIINETKGFMSPEEGQGLYDFAQKASQRGPGLEIGSYCGKSTLFLGAGFQKNNEILFTIDHHRGSEEQQPGEEYFDPDLFDDRINKIDTLRFLRTTLENASLEDTVIPIVSRSEVVAKSWRTPLTLLFIDGSHTFDSAETDYLCWTPQLIENGYLLIHDIFPDPSQGGQAPFHIYQKALNSGLFQEVAMIQTLGILKRR